MGRVKHTLLQSLHEEIWATCIDTPMSTQNNSMSFLMAKSTQFAIKKIRNG
jgi:hypothetical protein